MYSLLIMMSLMIIVTIMMINKCVKLFMGTAIERTQ